MSVIVARALPDVRDGLKPVHRRILWSMSSNGHRHDRGHVKCATVVGDVIARYHPPRRHRRVRRARADGPGLQPAASPGGPARQLRLARRSARRLPLHRVPPHRTQRRHAGRDRRGDGRLRRQLRRPPPGALGAAVTIPEPAGERQPGDRRGNGDQHPAAQPRRGGRRRAAPAGAPRLRKRGAHAVRSRPRLPHRWADPGALRGGGGLPHRAGHRAPAWPGRDRHRGSQDPDRGQRDSLPGQRGGHREACRPAGGHQGADRHPGHPQRVRQGANATGLRVDPRRPRAGHPQQPLQAHVAGSVVLGEHGGSGGRGASHAQPRATCWAST